MTKKKYSPKIRCPYCRKTIYRWLGDWFRCYKCDFAFELDKYQKPKLLINVK